MITWDWKAQPDLSQIGEAVRRLSGGRCDLREADTGGDSYAVVITGRVMDGAEAQTLFEAVYYAESREEKSNG